MYRPYSAIYLFYWDFLLNSWVGQWFIPYSHTIWGIPRSLKLSFTESTVHMCLTQDMPETLEEKFWKYLPKELYIMKWLRYGDFKEPLIMQSFCILVSITQSIILPDICSFSCFRTIKGKICRIDIVGVVIYALGCIWK